MLASLVSLLFGLRHWTLYSALWACYLSFVVLGREMLSLQADLVLLEAGFLAIWLAFSHQYDPLLLLLLLET